MLRYAPNDLEREALTPLLPPFRPPQDLPRFFRELLNYLDPSLIEDPEPKSCYSVRRDLFPAMNLEK